MLIDPGTTWPPPTAYVDIMRARWESWSAWWSGDLHKLRSTAAGTAPGGYWARHAEKQGKGTPRQLHMPLAADIARTSAELIFGDSPRLDWGKSATTVTSAWETLTDELGWTNALLEGAETAAALGGVYLRPMWDRNLADRPLATMVRPDDALPLFRFGQLAAVTFVTVLNEDPALTLRWLEHHEPGQIRHELWLGSSGNVGRAVPLNEHPVTAGLAETSVIDTTPIRPDGILCEYVPNDLPQPLVHLPHGRADVQGNETLLDALDEVWDSWIRDIRIGKGRILVSSELLDPVAVTSGGPSSWFGRFRRGGDERAFDLDAEAFSPLPGMPADEAGKLSPITVAQFALRVQEHADTAYALVDEIVSRAGYAPQTFGRHVEGQLSGTAMARRERRSTSTQGRKRQHWKPRTSRFAETLMLINAAVFNGPRPDARPALEWPTDQADPKENAETINLLSQAEAISTEIKVKMAHPEWEQKDVDDEVKRIKAENPPAPDPLDGGEPFPPPGQRDDPAGSGDEQ
ncbi:hypothetical protein [Amycolatopsis sp. cmx-4-54]|uniref:hypothetical protein n=1 Tax=Amycolatopsis sp. cmx-4-54 TaxID=2790936 RepID=UPI00397A5742